MEYTTRKELSELIDLVALRTPNTALIKVLATLCQDRRNYEVAMSIIKEFVD